MRTRATSERASERVHRWCVPCVSGRPSAPCPPQRDAVTASVGSLRGIMLAALARPHSTMTPPTENQYAVLIFDRVGMKSDPTLRTLTPSSS